MTRPRWLTKEVVGWAMFDFANQAYTIIILTAMFPVYFSKQIVAGDDGGVRGEQLWATCGMITQIIIIAVAPLAGALADFSGAKKRLLFITYLACVLLTASLSLIGPGDVALGSILFVLSYLFYGTGENFLGAFLPELARHQDMGKVSAFSWAVAYCGSLLGLAGAVVIVLIVGDRAGPDLAPRLTCVWAAVFFLAAGIPTFLWLRERKLAEAMPAGQTMLTVGFHRLARTFRDLRGYRMLFRYVAIMTIFFAGVQTVYWFSGIMTTEHFKFGQTKMLLFLMQVTITGVIGAIITGRFQDRIGTKTTILICLAYWAFTMILGAFAKTEPVFWIVGNLAGLGIGALGTASRVMVGLFSPPHKAAEFFGFWGMSHKLAAIIGLACTTLLLEVTDSKSVIIGANAVFFVVGFLLMLTVNEKEGRVAAIRAAREHVRKHHDFAGKLPTEQSEPAG